MSGKFLSATLSASLVCVAWAAAQDAPVPASPRADVATQAGHDTTIKAAAITAAPNSAVRSSFAPPTFQLEAQRTPSPPTDSPSNSAPAALRGDWPNPEPNTNKTPGSNSASTLDFPANVYWSIGIDAEPVPELLVMHLPHIFGQAVKAKRPLGLLITKVAPESPAAAVSLQPGDLILAVDDFHIAAPAEMQIPLHKAAGNPVQLTVVHNGTVGAVAIQAYGHTVPQLRSIVTPAASSAIQVSTQQGTVSVTGNGRVFQLNANYVDGLGRSVPINFSGNLDEVRTQILRLPEPLQRQVMQRLPNSNPEISFK